jgi:hypothetical protein
MQGTIVNRLKLLDDDLLLLYLNEPKKYVSYRINSSVSIHLDHLNNNSLGDSIQHLYYLLALLATIPR